MFGCDKNEYSWLFCSFTIFWSRDTTNHVNAFDQWEANSFSVKGNFLPSLADTHSPLESTQKAFSFWVQNQLLLGFVVMWSWNPNMMKLDMSANNSSALDWNWWVQNKQSTFLFCCLSVILHRQISPLKLHWSLQWTCLKELTEGKQGQHKSKKKWADRHLWTGIPDRSRCLHGGQVCSEFGVCFHAQWMCGKRGSWSEPISPRFLTLGMRGHVNPGSIPHEHTKCHSQATLWFDCGVFFWGGGGSLVTIKLTRGLCDSVQLLFFISVGTSWKKETVSEAMLRDLPERCPNIETLELEEANLINVTTDNLPSKLRTLIMQTSLLKPGKCVWSIDDKRFSADETGACGPEFQLKDLEQRHQTSVQQTFNHGLEIGWVSPNHRRRFSSNGWATEKPVHTKLARNRLHRSFSSPFVQEREMSFSLGLSQCKQITDVAVKCVASGLKKLQFVFFANCPKLTVQWKKWCH